MHALVFGGSRNIGYFTTLRLLSCVLLSYGGIAFFIDETASTDQGHSATLLLRKADVFDADERMKPHIESGKAQLVQGDALVSNDVERVWEKATDSGRIVDLVLFTIGATWDMGSFSVTKGVMLDPPNITTKAVLNVLCTMPESTSRPKIVAVTSIGVTKDSPIPLVYKPMYWYLLRGPHADKLGLERVLAHASGRKWDDQEPREDLTTVDGVKWQDRTGLPASGSLESLVIRPPLFVESKQNNDPSPSATSEAKRTDKDDEEKMNYRVGGPELSGTYTISREEIGHFIAENALKNWDQFKGKAITISR